MITIKVRNNDSYTALSKLKNILVQEELFKELKKRRYYVKPSLKKRFKREAAEKQRVKDFHNLIKAARRADNW